MSDAFSAFATLFKDDFAPLFADDDVSDARIAPDGTLTLTRRGRAEKIDAKAGELVAAAFAATGDGRIHSLVFDPDPSSAASTRAIARLDVTRVDSGVHLYFEKRARAMLPLAALEDAGILPDGLATRLISHASSGGDVVTFGPSRFASHQLIVALADRMAVAAPTFVLSGDAIDVERDDRLGAPDDAVPRLLPFALPVGASTAMQVGPTSGDLLENARACVDVGAVYLAVVDLSAQELASLQDAKLPAVLLVQSRAAAIAFDGVDVLSSLGCGFGFGPRGEPTLSMAIGLADEPSALPPPNERPFPSSAFPAADAPVRAVTQTIASANPRAIGGDAGPIVVGSVATESAPTSPLSSVAVSGLSGVGMSPGEAAGSNAVATPGPSVVTPGAPGVAGPAPGAQLPPLKPLGPAPPNNWLSDAPEMDPGWDVKSDSNIDIAHARAAVEAASGTIDEKARRGRNPDQPQDDDAVDVDADEDGDDDVALSAFEQTRRDLANKRPFKPEKPREHPQAKKLREDPFGGLTFEPPHDPSGASSDDDDDEDSSPREPASDVAGARTDSAVFDASSSAEGSSDDSREDSATNERE